LTVFLGAVLAKRYTNPSADIITVLAGLDEVDSVFFEFAGAIEHVVRTGRSRGAIPNLSKRLILIFRSRCSPQGYRGSTIFDFRGMADKPRLVLYTSRFISGSDEGI